MSSFVWDKSKNKWVDRREYVRPMYQGHYVISDSMEAAEHPATGQMVDSKSTFRKLTKQAGCIEVGDQRVPMRKTPLPKAGPDIKAVWESLE